jgi:uncharacterized membrane protein YeiB
LLVRNARRLIGPVATMGRRSLDCYIILSVVVIAVPRALPYRQNGAAGEVVVLAVLVACFWWCALKDRLLPRLRSRVHRTRGVSHGPE